MEAARCSLRQRCCCPGLTQGLRGSCAQTEELQQWAPTPVTHGFCPSSRNAPRKKANKLKSQTGSSQKLLEMLSRPPGYGSLTFLAKGERKPKQQHPSPYLLSSACSPLQQPPVAGSGHCSMGSLGELPQAPKQAETPHLSVADSWKHSIPPSPPTAPVPLRTQRSRLGCGLPAPQPPSRTPCLSGVPEPPPIWPPLLPQTLHHFSYVEFSRITDKNTAFIYLRACLKSRLPSVRSHEEELDKNAHPAFSQSQAGHREPPLIFNYCLYHETARPL